MPRLISPRLRRLLLRGFTYFGLIYYSQGLVAAIQAAHGDVARTVAGETNLASTIAQTLILLGLLLAVARRPGRYADLCRPVLPLVLIAGLALVSAAWSGDPVRTLRRATALAECILFGLFLFRTNGLERTIKQVIDVCVLMAVLSLVAFVAVPSIGRETALGYERALRGVFPQKNSMSECMLLGLACLAWRGGQGRPWRAAGTAGLLVLCLLLGRGASALAAALVVGLFWTWRQLRGRPVWRAALLFGLAWTIAAAVTALVVDTRDVFALAGRDTSFTGRVPLWGAILPEIATAPLLGHGYAGFWNAMSPTVQMIWRYAGWQAPDAHSSYLDILLQLGCVGLTLYLWAWARLFRLAAAAGRTGFDPAGFAWMYGVTMLCIGLDEGVFAVPNSWTALLPLTTLVLARHLRLARAAPVEAGPSLGFARALTHR